MERMRIDLFDDEDEDGKVRSDIRERIGTHGTPSCNVEFQCAHIIHGDYEPSDRDNASLLVLKASPVPKKPSRTIVKLTLGLTVLPEHCQQRDIHTLDDWGSAKLPTLISFEPAGDGAEQLNMRTTIETHETAYNGSFTGGAFGVSGGLGASSTETTQYKKNHMLRTNVALTRLRETRDVLPATKYNQVTWNLAAGTEDTGIGDSFTVALLVKRPTGEGFSLWVHSRSETNSNKDKLGNTFTKATQSIMGDRLHFLQGFSPGEGSSAAATEIPEGIDRHNLHAASTEDRLKQLRLGIHLPETAKLVKRRSPVEKTPQYASSEGEVLSESEPKQDAIEEHRKTMPTVTLGQGPATQSPTQTTCQSTPSLWCETAGAEIPHFSMTRVARHRKMAALYERLAELHREEAREYLPADERTYANQAERGT
ncbi:uncharacterized protein N7484_001075 [Penicillium longicatenatum]|uniref:uncharacterized protein n=1 Tax=Penicillium longicatenatum TaxID=1561947 RepID=UPI002546CD07|nr:uncharacterized protein N7484_001075 [Penicillium longicatenatum]KAJ5657426.1 hypothetical protein N7484_001075 [Penicillium longicatenatum]